MSSGPRAGVLHRPHRLPPPMDPIREAVPELLARRRIDGAGDAAEAIRTTDTVRKEVTVQGDGFTVGGMAKGAAMLSPHLATMLAVLTTDAEADAAVLTAALGHAVSPSFNELSVDGASSTNDTVLLLANGRAGSADPAALDAAVSEACASLAQQMNADAEGATKQVEIHVSGAATDEEGARAAAPWPRASSPSAPGTARTPTGAGRQRPGVRGSALRSRAGADLLRRHCGGSAGDGRRARRAGGRRAPRPAGDRDPRRPGHRPGRGRILTNDLTHAYVDENKGTS